MEYPVTEAARQKNFSSVRLPLSILTTEEPCRQSGADVTAHPVGPSCQYSGLRRRQQQQQKQYTMEHWLLDCSGLNWRVRTS